MISPDFLTACRDIAWQRSPTPPPDFSDFGFKDLSADNTRHYVNPGRISDSEYEAFAYYAGLPSEPVLVCRTGNTSWKRPTGHEAYDVPREARPVFDHQIATVWDNLGPKVPDLPRFRWGPVDEYRCCPFPSRRRLPKGPRSCCSLDRGEAPVSLWRGRPGCGHRLPRT